MRPSSSAREGNRLSDVSHAVRSRRRRRILGRPGVVGPYPGRSMHEDPQILNFGEPGRGPVLGEGMTLAIEPMITMGGPEIVVDDHGRSPRPTARWRHADAFAVTAEGPKVLTATGVLLR